jgi:NTP pyrophosphatase (non-canonical NTP hydrolase)
VPLARIFFEVTEVKMEDRLSQISEKAIQFRDARDWEQFHDPKNLAEAISIESGELLENFLWIKNTDKSYDLDSQKLEDVKEEIADIMIYLIYLCEGLKIDLPQAVENKIEMNGRKYPIEKAKGSSKKYKEFK